MVGRLSGFKYKEIISKLRKAGFHFDRQAKGSHEIWYNQKNKIRITIPNHPGDMPEGTLNAIIKQAGLTIEQFVAL